MKVKYMGSSHEHSLESGDDFGGRLSEGLSSTVVFNRDNNWIVDTDEAGLSSEAVEVMIESGDFKDVTDLKRIPSNENQKIFLGMGASEKNEEGAVPPGQDQPEGDEPATGSAEADANPTTTAGGSTRTKGTRGG